MKFKIIFLLVSLFLTQTFAQVPPAVVPVGSASSNKPTKKQTLNFEDELIEGNVSKPDLFYIFQKKNFNYKRLVKLRENFLPEMRKTTEDIQRVRGGH